MLHINQPKNVFLSSSVIKGWFIKISISMLMSFIKCNKSKTYEFENLIMGLHVNHTWTGFEH